MNVPGAAALTVLLQAVPILARQDVSAGATRGNIGFSYVVFFALATVAVLLVFKGIRNR